MHGRPLRAFRQTRPPVRRASFSAPTPAVTLLSLLSAAPENSWIKANTNTIQSVFPPTGYIATSDGSTGSATLPTAVIRCWSSFAWDPVNSRIVLYGGGHANYDGNEIYLFNGSTRQWQLGFYPTDVQVVTPPAEFKTVDGDTHSPVSSHTYGNNQYLPVLNKFVTFGGAAAHTGGALMIRDSGPTRKVGAFMLDLSQAGQGKVAGVTGSNVKHGHSVSLAGADAWSVRDWLLDHSMAGTLDASNAWTHVSTGAAYAQEGGKDVLYKLSFFNQYLWRIEFSASGYLSDNIAQVMTRNTSASGWDCAPAFDSVNRVLVALGGDSSVRLHGCNIAAYTGTPVSGFVVPDSGINASAGKSEWLGDSNVTRFGICFDTINARFLMWTEGGKVFSLSHGGGALTGNWNITKLSDHTGSSGVDRPYLRSELGGTGTDGNEDRATLGKWRWASDLNCVVTVQHARNGDVWLYKPTNWVAP